MLLMNQNNGIESLSFVDTPKLRYCIIVLSKKMACLKRGKTPSLVEFLADLPRVSHLLLDRFFIELLAAGGDARRLPTRTTCVKLLALQMVFSDLDVVSCTLLLIRSVAQEHGDEEVEIRGEAEGEVARTGQRREVLVRGVAGDVAPEEVDGNRGQEAQRIELNGDIKHPNSRPNSIATTKTATKTESTICTISEHPRSPHPCGFPIGIVNVEFLFLEIK
ncbi:hypothetical protein C3L33_17011, partial [Rhododendron williamsianum]